MNDTMKRKWIVLLCAAAVAACSKEPNSEPGPGGTVPIELSAGTQAGVETKSPIEGAKFPEMTPAFCLTATQGTGDAAPTDWTSPYFSDKAVNSAADGTLSWPEGQKQYYPADKTQKLYFYAYTPQGASVTAGTQTDAPRINYRITGSQDIMWAANTQGIKPEGAVADPVQLTFAHKLMQVRFKVAKSESFPIGEGETFAVTSIKIKDIRVVATLDLGSGALVFPEAEPKGTLTAYANGTGIALGDEAAEVPSSVMFEPQTSFFCEVTAGGTTYPNVKVTLSGEGAGTAGTNHLVTLTFKQGEISATATIAQWADGGEGATGEDAYPLVADGHTIVIKDLSGEADKDIYPRHKPWTVTPEHSESAWDANESGLNTFGEQFRVARANAKGKNGSAEDMTWYEASGTTHASSNPDGYSACAEYSEETDGSDKGVWRLPTMRELKLIWDRKSDLTSANPPSDGYYWSATKSNDGTWDVIFQTGQSSNGSRLATLYVRCVRDEGAEKPATVYPYVASGNTLVLKDRFGEADPAVYPLHKPWPTTPSHAEAAWDANTSGYNTIGERFRVAKAHAKGKDGSSVALTWYEASGTTHATSNPDGYSACAQYSEETDQSDQGLWRLPTMQEFSLIADKKEELTAANLPTTGMFWSATGSASSANSALIINISTGNKPFLDKINVGYVRCVRDLGLPPVSADYPKVASGNTLVVRDDKAMADPANYPTHEAWTTTPSHVESSWSNNSSGYNTYGERFQVASSDAKGKDGSSETMTWYEASGTTDATSNPDGYSACAEYSEASNQSDQGLWRLPTIREFVLIYDRKGELTVAPSGYIYWATTGDSWTSARAYSQNFSSRFMTLNDKTSTLRVRCVRDL